MTGDRARPDWATADLADVLHQWWWWHLSPCSSVAPFNEKVLLTCVFKVAKLDGGRLSYKLCAPVRHCREACHWLQSVSSQVPLCKEKCPCRTCSAVRASTYTYHDPLASDICQSMHGGVAAYLSTCLCHLSKLLAGLMLDWAFSSESVHQELAAKDSKPNAILFVSI